MKTTIFGVCAVAISALVVFWVSSGVVGDVLVISSQGKPLFAPGAYIWIFHDSATQNMSAFFASPLYRSNEEKFSGAIAANSQKYGRDPDILASLDLIPENAHCSLMWGAGMEFWGRTVATTQTDLAGHFSVRLRPGTYSILIRGQAGSQQAVWLETVHLNWRTTVEISEPICQCPVIAPEP